MYFERCGSTEVPSVSRERAYTIPRKAETAVANGVVSRTQPFDEHADELLVPEQKSPLPFEIDGGSSQSVLKLEPSEPDCTSALR